MTLSIKYSFENHLSYTGTPFGEFFHYIVGALRKESDEHFLELAFGTMTNELF